MMKKVKSYDTLLFKHSSPSKTKDKSPKSKLSVSPAYPDKTIKPNKSKQYRSKTKLFKEMENRYQELKDEWGVAVEEAKQRQYLYEGQKRQLERLKLNHQKDIKEISRLNIMVGMIKKKDSGNQVNMNEQSKGSWYTRQLSTEQQIKATIKDFKYYPKDNLTKSISIKTLYSEKPSDNYQDKQFNSTLSQIQKKKNQFNWTMLKKQQKLPSNFNFSFAQIKRLSNSPYSRVK